MARSLNKVQLIGNLTRDPELRYTPQGTAVCSFSVATNRRWKTESGELRDEADFHRVVAWAKLAEICAQLLKKGNKVFVEGRLQTRNWETADGQPRTTTEVVISDMILLTSTSGGAEFDVPEDFDQSFGENQDLEEEKKKKTKMTSKKKTEVKKATKSKKKEEAVDDDIPF